MRELEVPLLEGHNIRFVDLFDLRQARNVLEAFGRAHGAIPERRRDFDERHCRFLEQAIVSLAEDEKVICVRLALFAEMLKAKPWVSSTLSEMGGAEGIGVTYLEETFSAFSAPPAHRLHERGARAVLQALLPAPGTNIKGHMRSRGDLLVAFGYAARPEEFEHLLQILDGETRLLTPVEERSTDGGDDKLATETTLGGRYCCPANMASWDEGVRFCNWLSLKEGLTPCYKKASQFEWERDSRAAGYRLPTFAEWVLACRAGTITNYSCGNDERMLFRYALFLATHADRCAVRLPNAWSFFDMHGNLREWCEDWYQDRALQKVDSVSNGVKHRVMAGGCYTGGPVPVDVQNSKLPDYRSGHNGLRVAMNAH